MRKSTEEEERAQLNEEGVADGITDQTEAARRGELSKRKTDGGVRRRSGCLRIRSLCVFDSG